LLEQKQLPDGGWPAEGRYYSVSKEIKLNADYVDWGGVSKRKLNPWVTADGDSRKRLESVPWISHFVMTFALSVLVRAGRCSP
jgi:hypothetical protein